MTLLEKIQRKIERRFFPRTGILSQPVVWSIPTGKNLVALTFDDGPNDQQTLQILDILKKKNIRATFFLLGKNVKKFPKIAKSLVKAGHEVGNHTFSHVNIHKLSAAEIEQELSQADAAIRSVVKKRIRFFRPPYGKYRRTILPVIDKLDYQLFLWSIDPVNWKRKPLDIDLSVILRKTTDGTILLLHDGAENKDGSAGPDYVVKSLPEIIERLEAKGFRFVTLSQLLKAGKQYENAQLEQK